MGGQRSTGPPTHIPAGIPGAHAVKVQAGAENFPVALRVFPPSTREDLLAVYGFARLTDDIGDEYDGDRLAALDWLESDLESAASGHALHPLVASLTPTIHRHNLSLDPFRYLIEANRQDQRKLTYETYEELEDYCRLSANPVGRLVLDIFGASTTRTIDLSDRVCTGLQVIEHIQDIGEDTASGRFYMPKADLDAYGCVETDFEASPSPQRVRRLVEFECSRARSLLAAGDELASLLTAQPRVAIAGFVAGGRAAVDAVADGDYDVLTHDCRPSRRNVARHGASVLWKANRLRRSGADTGIAP